MQHTKEKDCLNAKTKAALCYNCTLGALGVTSAFHARGQAALITPKKQEKKKNHRRTWHCMNK